MAATIGLDPIGYIGLDFSYLTREEVMKRFVVRYEEQPHGQYYTGEPIKKPIFSKEYNILEMGGIDGETRWLDLGWFDMAQAFQEHCRDMRDFRRIRTVNCTEGGINASKYVEIMTLKEFNEALRSGYYEGADNRFRNLEGR
jgi:hypothetical protein